MIIDDIKTLLDTLPYPVTIARIDPFDEDSEIPTPAINIQYAREQYKQQSHAGDWYVRTTTVAIGVIVAETETYNVTVKTLTDLVLNTILSNTSFISQFRSIDDLQVVYSYQDAGETNYAFSAISFTLEDDYKFQPAFTTALEVVNVDIDDIDPYDHNIAAIGPDGRIEISMPINLPQE